MENAYYTKQQIKRLEDLEVIKHFSTVLDSNFKRGTTTELDNKVADIYEEATNTKVSRNFGCKSCVYNLYRDAGKLYRNSLSHYQAEQRKKMQVVRDAKNKKDNDGTKDGNTEQG